MKKLLAVVFFALSLCAHSATPVIPAEGSITVVTSCTVPCAVFFDATGTTDSSMTDYATQTFHEVDYTWGFGDPTSGVWSNGVAGRSRNAATGALAAHLYETPGTYTWMLTACDGSSCAVRTGTITVSAWDETANGKTLCVDNGAVPVPGVDGCPATAYGGVNGSDFKTVVNAAFSTGCGGSGCKRVLLRRGKAFTQLSKWSTGALTGAVIDAYGTVSDPIPTVTTTTFEIVEVSSSSAQLAILNIAMIGNSQTNTGTCISISGAANGAQLLAKGISCDNAGGGVVVATGGKLTNSFILDSKITAYYARNGVYGWIENSAILGNYIGEVPNSGSGEHGIRIQPGMKVIASNNTIVDPHDEGKSHITVRAGPHGTGSNPDPDNDTKYVIVSDNFLLSIINGLYVIQAAPASATQCNWGSDVIIERNFFRISDSIVAYPVITSWVRVTVRDNIANGGLSTAYFGSVSAGNLGTCSADPSPNPANALPPSNYVKFFNNTLYTTTSGDAFMISYDGSGPQGGALNGVSINNLLYAPNSSRTFNPYFTGTVTGLTYSSNSTDSWNGGSNDGTNQSKLVDPQFASATPFSAQDFRINAASYAATGGAANLPASYRDQFLCYSKAGNSRIGGAVPLTDASCSPQGFIFAPFK